MPYIYNPTTNMYDPISRQEAVDEHGYGQYDDDTKRDLYSMYYTPTGQLHDASKSPSSGIVLDPYTPVNLPAFNNVTPPVEHSNPKVTPYEDIDPSGTTKTTVWNPDNMPDPPNSWDDSWLKKFRDATGVPDEGVDLLDVGREVTSTVSTSLFGFDLTSILPVVLIMMMSGKGDSMSSLLPLLLIMPMLNKEGGIFG